MTTSIHEFLSRPIQPRSVFSTIMLHLRKKLIAGLVTMMPIAFSVFVSVWIFRTVVESTWLQRVAGVTRITDRNIAVAVAFLVTLGALYLIGLLSTTFLARQFIGLAERIVVHIPVVKLCYITTKQLMDTLNHPAGQSGRKVVVVEYPRKECYSIGFATGESVVAGELFVHVFVLTTPNPTSGWLLLLRTNEVWETNYTGEEAMKMILSGGIVGKPELDLKPYTPVHENVSERASAPSVPGGDPEQPH